LRKSRQTGSRDGANGERAEEALVSIRPQVLDEVEHGVGNLLQRIHHATRVSLAGCDAEQRDRVRVALSDLERLLELLFDYVSPVEIATRPTEAARVASSVIAQVRGYAGAGVEMVGAASGKLLVDPRALTRAFQLIGDSLGSVWKESSSVAVRVSAGDGGEGIVFAISAAAADGAAPLGASARVGLAVASRLIEMQGGELHWTGEALGACRVVLPTDATDGIRAAHGEGRGDGI
jgi:hypothetical protein